MECLWQSGEPRHVHWCVDLTARRLLRLRIDVDTTWLVLTCNGSRDLHRFHFSLRFARADSDAYKAACLATEEGVLRYSFMSKRSGNDYRAAFDQLRMELEEALAMLLANEVPQVWQLVSEHGSKTIGVGEPPPYEAAGT
jgi:hypothetical protein